MSKSPTPARDPRDTPTNQDQEHEGKTEKAGQLRAPNQQQEPEPTHPAPSARTYEIRTLDDFKKVPKKRLKACLREFAVAVGLTGAMEALVSEVENEMYGSRSIKAPLTCFRWIDDGQKNITANMTVDSPKETENVR